MAFADLIDSIYTKLLVSITLVLVFLGNLVYVINIEACKQANDIVLDENNSLSKSVEQIDNQEAYQNSLLFEEKEIKSSGYKLRGEQVINTSAFEIPPQDANLDYIPELENQNESNLSMWFDLLGSGLEAKPENTECMW
jgi:hypothetical protein